MKAISSLPAGGAVIDFLGHMRAPQQLQRKLLGSVFPTAVGLGPNLDTDAKALTALSRFGFGFLEVGPVTIEPITSSPSVERVIEDQALRFTQPQPNIGLEEMAKRLEASSPLALPLMIRIGCPPQATVEQATSQAMQNIERLSLYADFFSLCTNSNWTDIELCEYFHSVIDQSQKIPRVTRFLLVLNSDCDFSEADRLTGIAIQSDIRGILIDGSVSDERGRLIGSPVQIGSLELTRYVRNRWGGSINIISSGGIHQPKDALAFFDAGADLIQVDSGLVYSGPGLPKRINEALLYASSNNESDDPAASTTQRLFEMTWFWTLLLGIGMLAGSILALAISATRIILLYDENFLEMTRSQLANVNPRLLPFMAHDRVTLAGVMITIGILFVGLSLGGVRHGLHWAQQAILYSALAGFLSFFLFLGFGYFDPFHAFVTAILFQFLLMALHSRLGKQQFTSAPNLREDWQWRWNQWGQLLFVIHGFGLLIAGLVISAIGVTQVFVPEDLEFMQTSSEALHGISHRLVPLIAHDRATLGGMLISSGIAILLSSLWGFKQGDRWLWWTLLCAGIPAYFSTVGVHLIVGYINLWHLAPAFAAFGLFAVGLLLSYPYLCHPEQKNIAE